MDVLEEGSKVSLKNRFYKIKKTFVQSKKNYYLCTPK